jgi:hypothetical protein
VLQHVEWSNINLNLFGPIKILNVQIHADKTAFLFTQASNNGGKYSLALFFLNI